MSLWQSNSSFIPLWVQTEEEIVFCQGNSCFLWPSCSWTVLQWRQPFNLNKWGGQVETILILICRGNKSNACETLWRGDYNVSLNCKHVFALVVNGMNLWLHLNWETRFTAFYDILSCNFYLQYWQTAGNLTEQENQVSLTEFK